MGLLDTFFPGNPVSPLLDQNRNQLVSGFAGMVGAGNDPRAALKGFAGGEVAGRKIDTAFAQTQQEQAEKQAQVARQQQQQNQTIAFMQKKYPDLAAAAQNGVPLQNVYGEMWKREGATSKPWDYKTVGNDLIAINPNDPGQVRRVYEGSTRAENAPSGYRYGQAGNLEFIPGGPADPTNKASERPPTDAQRRASSLYEVVAPDAELLLGDGTAAKPGVFDALGELGNQAKDIGVFGLNPGHATTSAEYQRAQNALGNIAQSYLYAISGQAAPASEVAKIVDSVTPKPFESSQSVADKKARLATYVRAIQMAQQNGGGQQPAAQTTNGITWSIEP